MIELPSRFKRILETAPTNSLIVNNLFVVFGDILKENNLYFFEEYTDHGISHIQDVLASSDFIIPDETINTLDAQDITLLVAAVIFHDLGMHTTFEAFHAMIEGKYDSCRIEKNGESLWSELWNEYLREAKRFSSSQRLRLFGDANAIVNEPDISSKDNLNGRDRKLIGEFIRRHHARIAFEFCAKGIAGSNGSFLSIDDSIMNDDIKFLAGIIAQSHGIDMRDTFPRIKDRFYGAWKTPLSSKSIYLMAVIRIADYLQITSNRLQIHALKLKTFSSPLSKLEHETHLSIPSIEYNKEDPELIYAHCNPKSSQMYAKLEGLVTGLQNELDKSWAIIGEVYGSIGVANLKLKIRRISSNLNDKEFVSGLPYCHKQTKFVINDEVSRLLIAPLYGNNPSFAVRELIQNAVDACIEREYMESQLGNNLYTPEIDVHLSFGKDGDGTFTISDTGKGMSIDEIRNFYCNIGTSFRKSLDWKRTFIDNNGHSVISRTGKFGVGVLASFLLGNRISVVTRRFGSRETLKFEAEIDSDYIEIRKATSEEPVGTKIQIIVSRKVINSITNGPENTIKWNNWYVFTRPSIRFFVNGSLLSRQSEFNNKKWFQLHHDEYDPIYWRYEQGTSLACNGIFITKNLSEEKKHFSAIPKGDRGSVILGKPSMVIGDKNGFLPIRLDRNDLEHGNLSFDHDLFKDVCKHFIIELLSMDVSPTQVFNTKQVQNFGSQILFTSKGYVFDSDFFAEKLGPDKPFVRVLSNYYYNSGKMLSLNNVVIQPALRTIQLSKQDGVVAPQQSSIFFLHGQHYKLLFQDKTVGRLTDATKRRCTEIESSEEIGIYKVNGGLNQFNHLIPEIKALFTTEEAVIVQKWPSGGIGGKILNEFLEKYIGDSPVIPYDKKERHELYPLAFSELKKYKSGQA